MKMYIDFGSVCRKTSITTLAVMTLAGTASAQDTFTVKIKRVPGESVEETYSAMEMQAKKYCRRESRRDEDRISPSRNRHIYFQQCVDEVMGKVITQIKSPELTTYHAGKSSLPELEVSDTSLK